MKQQLVKLCVGFSVLVATSVFAGDFSGKPMSLNFTNVETEKVLAIISKFSGKGLVLPDDELGKLSVYIKDTPWDEILHGLSRSGKFDYEVSEGLIVISKGGCD